MSRRVVRCTIEMDLVEGEHFNYLERANITDEAAIVDAKWSFVSNISDLIEYGDIHEYVETKIVEEAS